jgi:hypothetical protein
MQERSLTETAGVRTAPPDLDGTKALMLYTDAGIARIQLDQRSAPGT